MKVYLVWHRERKHYYLVMQAKYITGIDEYVSLDNIADILKINYKELKENLKDCNGKIKRNYYDNYGFYGENVCYFKQKVDGVKFIEKFINPIIVANLLIKKTTHSEKWESF